MYGVAALRPCFRSRVRLRTCPGDVPPEFASAASFLVRPRRKLGYRHGVTTPLAARCRARSGRPWAAVNRHGVVGAPPARAIRARSRALASRGTSLLRGPSSACRDVACLGGPGEPVRSHSRSFGVNFRTAVQAHPTGEVPSSAVIQRSAQNWHGPGESDCLIKTKHCDGPNGC